MTSPGTTNRRNLLDHRKPEITRSIVPSLTLVIKDPQELPGSAKTKVLNGHNFRKYKLIYRQSPVETPDIKTSK